MKSIIRLTTLSPPPTTSPNPPPLEPPFAVSTLHSPKFSPLPPNTKPPIKRIFIVHPPPPPPPPPSSSNNNSNNYDDDNNNNNENNGDGRKGIGWPRWILWGFHRWLDRDPDYKLAVGLTGMVATRASVNFLWEMIEISLTLTLSALGFTLIAAFLIVSLFALFLKF